MGRSHHYVARSCQHNSTFCNNPKYQRIRRLGWVGNISRLRLNLNLARRTKKKDIYVISTPKRPVPLEHFLYAGRETFKIVNAAGEFLSQG